MICEASISFLVAFGQCVRLDFYPQNMCFGGHIGRRRGHRAHRPEAAFASLLSSVLVSVVGGCVIGLAVIGVAEGGRKRAALSRARRPELSPQHQPGWHWELRHRSPPTSSSKPSQTASQTPPITPHLLQTWAWELLQRQSAVSRCHVVLAVSPPARCQPYRRPPSLFAPLRSYDVEMLVAVFYWCEIANNKLY